MQENIPPVQPSESVISKLPDTTVEQELRLLQAEYGVSISKLQTLLAEGVPLELLGDLLEVKQIVGQHAIKVGKNATYFEPSYEVLLDLYRVCSSAEDTPDGVADLIERIGQYATEITTDAQMTGDQRLRVATQRYKSKGEAIFTE